MKTFQLSLVGLLLLLVVTSCSKREELPMNGKNLTTKATHRQRYDPNSRVMTVLGRKKGNPYSVAIMTQAWNSLYESVTTLPATNLYVRFRPHNEEELARLVDLGFDLSDTPMDYEIAVQGSYYHDPAIPNNEITWQYCVVKNGSTLPNVEHEVLSELFLASDEFELTRVAYYLAGEAPSDYQPYIQNQGSPDYNVPCAPEDPGFPECAIYGSSPTSPSNGGSGTPPTTSGGCEVNANELFPAGSVKVEDTQLGTKVGVKRVRVKASNGWFTTQTVETNDNGCFQFTKNFKNPFAGDYYGSNGSNTVSSTVKITVEFENSRASIRGLNEWTVNKYSQIVKDDNHEYVNSFNNINIEYERDNDISVNNTSEKQRLWMAATTQNSVQEFFQFATQQNIGVPPTQLKIMTTTFTASGATPMLHKILGTSAISIGTWLAFTDATLSVANPAPSIVAATLQAHAPDVIIGYRNDINLPVNFNLPNSADVKELCYHEIAHAAHFAQVGNNMWVQNMAYIAAIHDFNNPYGDGTLAGADRCAIIEAWAYHIGHFFTDLQYGQAHCNSPIVNQEGVISIVKTSTQSSNIRYLELYNPNLSSDPTHWIPQGIMWDLMDNTPNESFPVDDDAAGFTNQQFFNALTSNVQSPTAFRDMLLQQNGNNQQTVVNDLFQSYGF